jgi:hypothetical protein
MGNEVVGHRNGENHCPMNKTHRKCVVGADGECVASGFKDGTGVWDKSSKTVLGQIKIWQNMTLSTRVQGKSGMQTNPSSRSQPTLKGENVGKSAH